jgi:hypothetical protein
MGKSSVWLTVRSQNYIRCRPKCNYTPSLWDLSHTRPIDHRNLISKYHICDVLASSWWIWWQWFLCKWQMCTNHLKVSSIFDAGSLRFICGLSATRLSQYRDMADTRITDNLFALYLFSNETQCLSRMSIILYRKFMLQTQQKQVFCRKHDLDMWRCMNHGACLIIVRFILKKIRMKILERWLCSSKVVHRHFLTNIM